jgi:hypothetical protein
MAISYQIAVINPSSGQTVTIIDASAVEELRYSRILNGIGTLALVIPVADDFDWSTIFTLDSFVEVYRSPADGEPLLREETYLTRLVHRFREDQMERFVIGARSLNDLLARRIIDPDDDPNQSGGYSTKGGPADTIMREYVREQAADLASVDRQIPGLSVPTVTGTGNNTGARRRHDNLLEVLQDLTRPGAMDFQIVRVDGTTLECQIARIGEDKRPGTGAGVVVFNPLRGNLRNPSLVIDRADEGNFVYALGEGQGTNRVVLRVPSPFIADSPFNRREFTHDARTAEGALTLLTEAEGALEDNSPRRELTFDLVSDQPGVRYRIDWDIGDIVQARWAMQIEDLRIVSVEITINEAGEQLLPEVEQL